MVLPSPEERAKKVYSFLKKSDFSNWDLVCFAVEYLASSSLVWTWMQKYIKPLVRIVYTAHYVMTEDTLKMEGKVNELEEDFRVVGEVSNVPRVSETVSDRNERSKEEHGKENEVSSTDFVSLT